MFMQKLMCKKVTRYTRAAIPGEVTVRTDQNSRPKSGHRRTKLGGIGGELLRESDDSRRDIKIGKTGPSPSYGVIKMVVD